MKLYVYVLEGKDWKLEQSFLQLKVGNFKSRTRVLNNTNNNPIWNEEFVFRVHSLDDDELVVSVYHHHDHVQDHDDDDESSGLLKNGCGDLVGRVRIPLWSVAAEENQQLQPTWFSVETHNANKLMNKECG